MRTECPVCGAPLVLNSRDIHEVLEQRCLCFLTDNDLEAAADAHNHGLREAHRNAREDWG